ncbi:UDP-4-amino-4,6-dideoxy-N-acetyl-beta-L-altrosamine N-acetyltransferase [Gracilibacillus sp. YIM 98692]|uniref:UDP-4-amino-4, 6-dideoxy-N-acetyl-beta-L-altrosamine N-acetyltransferase n=1 Tax=Gracilibacillus sp. YIM 98692 TaxID=2663532 RepID=UPI0013D411B7|nr:UDP-4-amino-4,6-dideoxy-N-acetyl-beta-L-altrosamine N-acetyltransferase [Gracilibacillus sp. YIM 98692]
MGNTGDFQLKPLSLKDLKKVLKWRNSNRIKSSMYTDHHITWEEHYQWFKNVSKDSRRIVWLLYHQNQPLGLVNFSDIDKGNSRCYWGFYIGEETAPKGSGTIMAILALNKIFNEVGLHKVCSEVIHTNSGSIHYHKKLGFEPEGKFVDHVWKDGQFLDVIPMALFKEKWGEVKKQLIKDLGGG